MRRENKRKGLNRLLVLVLAAAVTMAFSFTSISFAAEETGRGDSPGKIRRSAEGTDSMKYYVTNDGSPGIPSYKFYDGKTSWNSKSELPRATVDPSLVEGKDYVRIYYFSKDKSYNGPHYGTVTPDQDFLQVIINTLKKDPNVTLMTDEKGNYTNKVTGPGTVFEYIIGIGDRDYAPDTIRHQIKSVMNISIANQTKYEGEEDPEVTYIKTFDNDAPNQYSAYTLSFDRPDKGEKPGVYSIQGQYQPTEKSPELVIQNKSVMIDGKLTFQKQLNVRKEENGKNATISYVAGDTTEGYLYIKIWDGSLTIKKKSHLIYNSNTSQPSEVTSDGKWKPGEESEKLQTAKELNFQNSGYTLTGWNTQADGKGTSYKPGDTYKFTDADDEKDVTLYAQWKKNSAPYVPVTPSTPTEEHTVTFHPANGQDNFTQTVADGNKVSQPADPTQDGYTFNGWYTDSAHTNAYDFDTPVNKDIDLYAKWTKNNPSPNPVKKVKGILLPKVIANGSSEQTFTWTPLTNVDGYFVYEAYCNTYKNVHPFKKVADVSASSPRVYKRSGLKKGAAYKYYVAAYQIKDGKKQIVKKSVTVHSAAGNLLKTKKAAYTNVKNVSVKKNAVTLKIGKTYKIQPSVKGVYSGYAILQKSHAPMYRYLYIKDGKNISVDQNGNVKALKAGKCNVYVLGTNGVRTKVAVTVK